MNHSGKKFTTNGVRYHIKKIMKLTGLSKTKKITPHSFRRSFATWCNNNGINIGLIKVLMGHRSLRTT